METHLPTPVTARVYVNLLEGNKGAALLLPPRPPSSSPPLAALAAISPAPDAVGHA